MKNNLLSKTDIKRAKLYGRMMAITHDVLSCKQCKNNKVLCPWHTDALYKAMNILIKK
jgi:hypothetical protein